ARDHGHLGGGHRRHEWRVSRGLGRDIAIIGRRRCGTHSHDHEKGKTGDARGSSIAPEDRRSTREHHAFAEHDTRRATHDGRAHGAAASHHIGRRRRPSDRRESGDAARWRDPRETRIHRCSPRGGGDRPSAKRYIFPRGGGRSARRCRSILKFRSSPMRVVVACGVLCLLGVPALVQGQGNKKNDNKDKPGSKCEIDLNSPAEMFSAALYQKKATDAKADTGEADKNWRSAVGALSASGFKNPNPPAYDYIVGQALITLGTRPGAAETGPRSSYGYKDNPTGTIDPLATADTLLNQLAAAKPLCEPVAISIREQGYIPLYNIGAKALGSNALDTAKQAAARAVVLDPKRPEAYNLLAGVALKQKDLPAAATNYKKVIETSGSDSGFAKTKQGALFNLGVVEQNQADAATGDQKKDFAKQAADAWTQYLQMNPTDADAKGALARAQQSAGDTAAVTAAYTDMIA